MGLKCGYAYSTVHVMLYAIRFKHMMSRYEDPLKDKAALRLAMKGLKRMHGRPVRKIPASH